MVLFPGSGNRCGGRRGECENQGFCFAQIFWATFWTSVLDPEVLSALVSNYCCNKSPWMSWLKTKLFYSLGVMKFRNIKSRHQQGCVPHGGFKGNLFPCCLIKLLETLYSLALGAHPPPPPETLTATSRHHTISDFSLAPFSLSSFTFIKRFFSSSSLSAIRVVSSAYLKLLIFLPAILIPVCASSSPAYRVMYSAYKLNKRGEALRYSFSTWNQCNLPDIKHFLSAAFPSWE